MTGIADSLVGVRTELDDVRKQVARLADATALDSDAYRALTNIRMDLARTSGRLSAMCQMAHYEETKTWPDVTREEIREMAVTRGEAKP